MKTNICTLLLVASIVTLVSAQSKKPKPTSTQWATTTSSSGQRAFLYEFSMDTMGYVELSNPVSINQGEIWDDPFFAIPMAFPFYLMGEKIDFFSFAELGGMLLGYNYLNIETATALAPFDTDLMDRGSLGNVSLSPLSYHIMGEPGDRKLVIEWKNAGSYDEMSNLGTMNMYINFQIWLYESDNRIIYHYGPSMINKPFDFYTQGFGAVIGLAAQELENMNYFDYHHLDGPAVNPILIDEFSVITGTPPNGTRYIFTPSSSSNSSLSTTSNIRLFPNPAGDILYVTCEEPILEMTLFSIDGTPLKNIPGPEINGSINIGDLPSGVYMVHWVTAQGVHVSPILKK